MERKDHLCSNLKQQTVGNNGRNMKQVYHGYKAKDTTAPWDFGTNDHPYYNFNNNKSINLGAEGGDLVGGGGLISWPPRCYTCSFCKREFRSAQALGGHMNVHRRDRARLRMSPPKESVHGNNNTNNHGQFSLLNLNPDSNPSLNSNPTSNKPSLFQDSPHPPISSLYTKIPQFTSSLPRSANNPQSCKRPMTRDLINVKGGPKGLFGVEKFGPSVHEKRCEVFKTGEFVRLDLEIGLFSDQPKEEMDLELRLGCS